jgi:hypothetical protein
LESFRKLLVEINDEQAWEKYLTYRNEKQKHQKKQVIKPEDDCSEEDEGDEEPGTLGSKI